MLYSRQPMNMVYKTDCICSRTSSTTEVLLSCNGVPYCSKGINCNRRPKSRLAVYTDLDGAPIVVPRPVANVSHMFVVPSNSFSDDKSLASVSGVSTTEDFDSLSNSLLAQLRGLSAKAPSSSALETLSTPEEVVRTPEPLSTISEEDEEEETRTASIPKQIPFVRASWFVTQDGEQPIHPIEEGIIVCPIQSKSKRRGAVRRALGPKIYPMRELLGKQDARPSPWSPSSALALRQGLVSPSHRRSYGTSRFSSSNRPPYASRLWSVSTLFGQEDASTVDAVPPRPPNPPDARLSLRPRPSETRDRTRLTHGCDPTGPDTPIPRLLPSTLALRRLESRARYTRLDRHLSAWT
ncbi:hypothetical protein PUNSTDRAFT_146243 [Punctularia strigosozonata HHB-11173 SS5]|uniref:Uncharacterized protein n=1 Tax=Punctularia strigosozonata (strain HHB-11173) TaxID=741275 RepID=R7S511_PUNST|nr:uncharacterized protein PUNSTDRAFT_146243 [Punctularia strigosozonata HHB-11173 SS5]EIN04989.1 hypothetical protein PUNSTDRAFT_146243 [Punctularia strigosozonata HHB-11173 SS5]